MNSEHLTQRQLKIPDAAPEPLAQLLARAQQGLSSAPGLDTVRWLHDSLAFLTEFFAAFSLGALKTVGPYSNSLEQLIKTAPSLDRSERLLAQAFIDWRSHPHHPAYESLRDAFFLTSRLQSSRTAPRRHTRWLGVEGRGVEGLEQLSRWSRRLDLLVGGDDDAAAREQIRLYLPVLWIWTDALEGFFRDWSLQVKSEVEDGKLRISGTANRDDIHLQLFSSHAYSALKADFVAEGPGKVRLDGFAALQLNGAATTTPVAEVAAPDVPETAPVPAAEPVADPGDIELVYDDATGTYAIADPAPVGEIPGPDALDDLPGPDDLPELPGPDDLPELPGPEGLDDPPSPDDLPELPGPEGLDDLPGPEALPALPSAPDLSNFSLDLESDADDPARVAAAASTDTDLFQREDRPGAPHPVGAEPDLFETPPVFAEAAAPVVSPEPAPAVFESTPEAAEPEVFEPLPVVLDPVVPEPVVPVAEEVPLFEAPPAVVEPEPVAPVAEEVPLFEPAVVEPEPVAPVAEEVPLFEAPPAAVEPEPVVAPVAEEVPLFEVPPAAAEPVAPIAEPDMFAVGNLDLGSGEGPLFASGEGVVPVVPSFELPTEPATPWADLMSVHNDSPSSEPEPDGDDDDVDASAPMPEFISAAPSRAELPDFSDDMPDFGFGNFGAQPAAEEPVAPVLPDFTAPPVAEEPAAPVLPDFSVPPVAEEPVAPVLPDFMAPPVAEEPAAPALPDFTAPPVAEEPVAPVLPDFTAPPVAEEPVAPVLPDFTAPPVAEEPVAPVLPDFSAPPAFSFPSAEPAAPTVPAFSFPPAASDEPPAAPVFEAPSPAPEFVPPAAAPAPEAFPSFEPEPAEPVPPAPANQAMAMGAQAEEILDDDFKFSAEAGPTRPQWKGWGVSEREAVQQACAEAVGATLGKLPAAYSGPVFQALRSDVNRFQVVLGAGCGKSHLAQDLCALETQGPFGPALLLEWPGHHNGDVGGQELLAIYFQLRDDARTRSVQALLPEPETVATLAAAADKDGFASAFQRLLGQLALLNRAGLTLILDEPHDGIRQNLPAQLPGRLRVISLVTALNSIPELGAKVELQSLWPQAAMELFGPTAGDVVNDPAANLLRVGLYAQLRAAGGAAPGTLADIGSAVLTSARVDADLLACLAVEKKPVSLDDLDQWFLNSSSVVSCIRAFPSLFGLRNTRMSPQLGLSHPSIEGAVVNALPEAYSKAANRLLGWVVAQLERTSPDKYGGLQVREIVLRNFVRLYRFASLTGSREIVEWVNRNKDLQRNRVALTTHLEKPANRWELQRLLELLSESLRGLVAGPGCEDLRDELAWALSHLALNQLHLGLATEARENAIEALDLFGDLVEKEKQHEFRPALATTLYRAARIAETLGLIQEARGHADKAVSELVELVEDRGRSDLQSRLGIAIAQRGGLKNDAGDAAGAMKDLQRAATLLASSSEEKQRENKASQIEVQLDLASIYLQARDFDNAIKESGKAVQLATQAVEELQFEELQPLLASCHTSRARCFLELNETDRAQRDVSKSISLRNLAVDEGRLDQRFELSKEYVLRSQIDRGRGMSDDAARDLSRAVELLEQLDAEGRRDAKSQLLLCLVERSNLALAGGDSARSIEDLRKAFAVSQADTSGSPESAQARLSVLDGLLRAYLRAGDSDQALNVATELLTQYQANGDWDNYGRVQVVRGDALERQSNLAASNESYGQAIGLLSKLMEQGQTDDRLALLAEAYLGSGSVELKLGNSDHANEQIKRSLDIFTHLFQQRGVKAALPKMLKAYSLFGAVSLNKGKVQDALVSLKSGFDILGYLEKEGGAAADQMDLRKAELYRARARALMMQGEVTQALHDSEEAQRNFLLDRQKNQNGPWKDELARTWTLRSQIFFLLKDFTQAENSVQEAIAHFEEQVRAGRWQYFDDLLKALGIRAENSGKAGKIDRVLEEYGRMLAFAAGAGQAGSPVNVDLESARILERRARVYRDQSLFNEAYGDYEKVIGLYRKLLGEGFRADMALDLVRVHLERGEMISSAGHAEHAIGDYTQAVDLAKALLNQGQFEAASPLARALHKRSDCFRLSGKQREALQDLDGAVGFLGQMAQQRPDPELLGNLAKALLSQGTLLAGFQQMPQAAASLDKAIGLFTNLVEQQGQRQHSSDMAQALIQRVSLTGDKTDPAMRQVLIRAVDLVTQQAREGKPVARDFPIDCLRAVVDLLTREDFDTVGDLIDAVLRLVELVVADGKSNQDFVKLTDLLLAASAGLIDDRRTARRPHFLALACVSCNREIQMFGKNSLPRLVYCLYELGQALERSKPPTVLNYIGSSFALLGELASQQQNNEDFLRELKMMVTTWRSLPPQVPALANVSRHMLSQLLRLT